MTELTHERVSELLGPYSTAQLDSATRADVTAHLVVCDDCARELAGITALNAGAIEPLTGPERERITAAVRAAVVGGTKPAWTERWGRRVAPALGAAALVAVAVVGYVSFQGDQSDLPAAGTATPDEGRGGRTVEDAGTFGTTDEAGAPAPGSESQDMQIESGTGTALGASEPGGPPVAVAVEQRFAAYDFTPDLFAPRDSRKANRTQAAGLAVSTLFAADDPDLAALVEECARTVIGTSPYALTPSYAAHFPADDIVVIGFVWRDEPSGALNFELRGWRGRSCDLVTPIYRSGPL
jgi:hypothetical protein